jgi:hypothetical protein
LNRLYHITTLSHRPYRKIALKELASYAKQTLTAQQRAAEPKQKRGRFKDKSTGFTHFITLPLATSDPDLKAEYS